MTLPKKEVFLLFIIIKLLKTSMEVNGKCESYFQDGAAPTLINYKENTHTRNNLRTLGPNSNTNREPNTTYQSINVKWLRGNKKNTQNNVSSGSHYLKIKRIRLDSEKLPYYDSLESNTIVDDSINKRSSNTDAFNSDYSNDKLSGMMFRSKRQTDPSLDLPDSDRQQKLTFVSKHKFTKSVEAKFNESRSHGDISEKGIGPNSPTKQTPVSYKTSVQTVPLGDQSHNKDEPNMQEFSFKPDSSSQNEPQQRGFFKKSAKKMKKLGSSLKKTIKRTFSKLVEDSEEIESEEEEEGDLETDHVGDGKAHNPNNEQNLESGEYEKNASENSEILTEDVEASFVSKTDKPGNSNEDKAENETEVEEEEEGNNSVTLENDIWYSNSSAQQNQDEYNINR